MKLKDEPVDAWHLEDYIQCPNYAKYNWVNGKIRKHHYLYWPIRNILMSGYRDLANLEKKPQWKTFRSRVHGQIGVLLDSDLEVDKYYTLAKRVIEQIRGWYLKAFRDGPATCLYNLRLETHVPATGMSIAADVDAILLSPGQTSIVEITDRFKNLREAISSLSIRSKVWMLSQENIRVNSVILVRIDSGVIRVERIQIHDYDDYTYKTERVIQWAMGSMKHQIFMPAITEKCKECPYKEVCSW